MTSPAQLKYLDAIGIPVWVSRDLIKDAPIKDTKKDGTSDFNDKSKEGAARVEHHVDHILQDLAQQTLKAPAKISVEHSPKKEIISPELNPSIHQSQPDLNERANEIGRTSLHTTYACGNLKAEWLIIGESPELNSNRRDEPFSGDAGVLLSNMLRAVGIDNPRENAYLINTIKSSVPSTPELEAQSSDELLALELLKIKQIQPKLLLVVGQIAAQRLLGSKEPLARLRGKAHLLAHTETPLLVTYYPTYLLSKPLDKRKAWEDLKLAMKLLD